MKKAVIGEHYELLPLLIEEKIETLIHFDNHLDYGFIEPSVIEQLKRTNVSDLHKYQELPFIIDQKGYNIGNFLYAAHHLGSLKTILWILPNCLDTKKDGLRAISQLQNVEMSSFLEAKQCEEITEIIVDHVRIIIVSYKQLHENLLSAFGNSRMLLDIDMDFLINYETGEHWLSEKELFEKIIDLNAFQYVMGYALCHSIESGFSPISILEEQNQLEKRICKKLQLEFKEAVLPPINLAFQQALFYTNNQSGDHLKMVSDLKNEKLSTEYQGYFDEVYSRLLSKTGHADTVIPYFEARRLQQTNNYSDGINVLKMYIKYNQVPKQITWLDEWATKWEFWMTDYYVGMTYLFQKSYEQAKVYLLRSHSKNPINRRIYAALVRLYKETQDTEALIEAIKTYSLVE